MIDKPSPDNDCMNLNAFGTWGHLFLQCVRSQLYNVWYFHMRIV